MDIQEELKGMADEKLRGFSSVLIPGTDIMGVRIPQLRQLAKRIAAGEEWEDFLKRENTATFEERLLHGLVVGYAKMPIEERLAKIKDFVPRIDSWAVCDCACSTFKAVGKHLPETLDFLQPYLDSDEEYELRFGIVMLMDYFINDKYIDYTLQRLDLLRPQQYYARMAVAWALSACFAKYPEKTLEQLRHSRLDRDTYNKALQKIVESRRVALAYKETIRGLKR